VVQNAYVTLQGARVPESSRLQRAESFRQTAAVLRLTRAGVPTGVSAFSEPPA